MLSDPPLPSGFSAAEAPWTLQGEAWWLPLRFFGGGGVPQPPGTFDPLEARSAELARDPKSFLGGMGVAMVIRYHDSPVGPYDELLLSPGEFSLPEGVKKPTTGTTRYRVTRIYVSTVESIANGRRNWNIPKHLAKFDFTKTPGGQTEVRIYAPNSDTSFVGTPFFAVRLTDSNILPSFPLNTRHFPMSLDLAQPPLEASSDAASDGLVGTETWKYVPGVAFRGKVRVAHVQGLLEADERSGPKGGRRIGDGKGFPDIKPWSSLVVHWTSSTIKFPAPEILS